MIAVFPLVQYNETSYDDYSVTIEAGGKTRTEGRSDGMFFESGQMGRWITHSGDSLDVTFTSSGTGFSYCLVDLFGVAVYQPTVSVDGGGSIDEDGVGNGDFVVYRDKPLGWQGTSNGDDAIPAVHVDLDKNGSATEGVDYTLEPDVMIPTQATATDPDYVDVPLTVLDDTEAEGLEDVQVSIAENDAYEMDQGHTTAIIDDNVSVHSIEVYVIPAPPNDPQYNKTYGYNFYDEVKLTGEHLDKVEITQLIQSSLTMTSYTGHVFTRNELLNSQNGLYLGSDPNVVDSNGAYVTDTGWSYPSTGSGYPLYIAPDTHNGIAYQDDHQRHQGRSGAGVQYDAARFDPNDANSPVTHVWYREELSRYFQIYAREIGTNRSLDELDWGYKWTNYNAQWHNNPYPELSGIPGMRCRISCAEGNIFGGCRDHWPSRP